MTPINTVVITSIFRPTEAVKRFAELPGWRCIVVGDRKTPEDWGHDGVEYLSVKAQARLPFSLAALLPFNHYCRKNLGYLAAASAGAPLVLDTDDDNFPKDGWSHPQFEGEFLCTDADEGYVNTYSQYTTRMIWPRGLPLQYIAKEQAWRGRLKTRAARVGVWQGLADGDPDVDAIYRLTRGELCTFDSGPPIVLEQGTCCPFNSQNTVFRRELFPLLYLPSYVSFRFTDILRGLIAQPLMWRHGYRLGFCEATVVQERNPHDYFSDFKQEIECYLHCHSIIDAVASAAAGAANLGEQMRAGYEALVKLGIVPEKELPLLSAWLTDCRKLSLL